MTKPTRTWKWIGTEFAIGCVLAVLVTIAIYLVTGTATDLILWMMRR